MCAMTCLCEWIWKLKIVHMPPTGPNKQTANSNINSRRSEISDTLIPSNAICASGESELNFIYCWNHTQCPHLKSCSYHSNARRWIYKCSIVVIFVDSTPVADKIIVWHRLICFCDVFFSLYIVSWQCLSMVYELHKNAGWIHDNKNLQSIPKYRIDSLKCWNYHADSLSKSFTGILPIYLIVK